MVRAGTIEGLALARGRIRPNCGRIRVSDAKKKSPALEMGGAFRGSGSILRFESQEPYTTIEHESR